MNKLQRAIFMFSLVGLFGFSWPWAVSSPNTISYGTNNWVQHQVRILKSNAANIDTKVLRLSLIAYMKAREKGVANKQILTVIDYSKPSYEKRLWVFDLRNGKTLYNTWVSHGRNSGDINATSFSNSVNSLKSSIGVFVTRQPYMGHLGYALRLSGLEEGINDNAYRRAVVIHGARYVNEDTIRKYGRIGRSWGCPAVSQSLTKPLINTIKNNTLVFVYYPDRQWFSHSQFLAT
jgi:hypothetical protein